MSELADTAVSLANLLLAVRYPFPLYITWIEWDKRLPLRAALALAPQLQAAQARRIENVYGTIIRDERAADALRDNFAAEFLCRNLPEQHLLCSLPVLGCTHVASNQDKQYLQRALHAIHDRLGYAFFESAIHACVGYAQVSQEYAMKGCVDLVCDYFPNDILSLAQRYGDLIIRLHGAAPFLTMLHRWCTYQAHQTNQSRLSVSQEALVDAFDSPLTRAAAMILNHPNLLIIDSPKAVEAAFDALTLVERARLLLNWNYKLYNIHASSVGRKLRLLGFDPSIQTAAQTYLGEENISYDELLVRCLLHVPDLRASHALLTEACKQAWNIQYTLTVLVKKELPSDEARMSLAQVLINAPYRLYNTAYNSKFVKNIQQFARSLPDASLRAALEARLAWEKQTYKLSKQCVSAVKRLIINRFGAQLEQLQDSTDIAKVYDVMLQDHAWLSIVDEAVVNILGTHSLPIVDTMYSISSEPEQGI